MLLTAWSAYEALHEVRGPAGSSPGSSPTPPAEGFESQAWAQWAPGLVSVLQQAWLDHVRVLPEVRKVQAEERIVSPTWQEHVAADHVPSRKDCEVCLQAASRGRAHHKSPHPQF